MDKAADIQADAEIEDLETGDTDTGADDAPKERDYEAEARQHGWTPKEEFRGDPGKWVDAETFAKRADEVMPFLKKQNGALKRELEDLKRTTKQFARFAEKAEERAYNRALADLQAKHDAAVEDGDKAGARAVLKEMSELKREAIAVEDEKPDPKQAQREFAAWVEDNDWYVTDETKRAYADIQAGAMGRADEYEGGPKAWLDELSRRVDRKFAERKPNPVSGGGNRSGGSRGAKGYGDLPPAAKAMCDKFVRTIPGFTKEQYVRDYDWSQ